MEEKIKIIISQLGNLRIKKNVNLNEYILSKPETRALALYIATSTTELIKAVSLCRELKLPFLLIGSGSKLSLSAAIFQGLVIKNRSHHLKIFGVKGKVSRLGIGVKEAFIEAGSGVTLSDLAEFSLKQGLGGFEDLSEQVGTVGGSILNNILLRDKTVHVDILDNFGDNTTKDLKELHGNDVVLKVIFHLKAKEV